MSKKKSDSPFVYSTNPEFLKKQEQDPEPPAFSGEVTPIVFFDTRHRGGKTVTIITGMRLIDSELEQIAKKIKVYCGTGGSLKDGEVIIQGDQREKVFQWLLKNGFSRAKKK